MRILILFCGLIICGCSSLQEPHQPNRKQSSFSHGRIMVADDDKLTDTSSLPEIIAYTLKKNANVREAFFQWKAALRKVDQEGFLPDPQLNFGYFIDEVETKIGPQEYKLGIRQKFPWFGKLQLREDVVSKSAMAAGQQFINARNRVALEVKLAYADWYFLEQSIRVTDENVGLIEELLKVVKSRHGVGKVNYSDLIRLEIELSRQKDRRRNFVSYRQPVLEKLNNLIQQDQNLTFNVPTKLPKVSIATESEAELYTLALKNNPTFKQLDFLIEKSLIEAKLAEKDLYPDVTLGIDYTNIGGGDDAIMAVVGINLPIWRDKYRAAVEEFNAKAKAMALRKETKERLLKVEIAEAIYQLNYNQRQTELYDKDIIPQTRHLLSLLSSSYASGKTGYVELIDAQQSLLKFELKSQEAILKKFKVAARLQFMIGN